MGIGSIRELGSEKKKRDTKCVNKANLIEMMTVMIPFPYASGNHAWKHSGRRHYLTEKAKKYYWDVAHLLRAQNAVWRLEGSIEVEVLVYPPDARKRDLDNVWKVAADALTKGGLWVDDEIIHDLRLLKMKVDGTARIEVRIKSVNGVAKN